MLQGKPTSDFYSCSFKTGWEEKLQRRLKLPKSTVLDI